MPIGVWRVSCDRCIGDRRMALRQLHADRLAAGICVRCGRAPPDPGLKMCESCLGKQRERQKRNQIDGLCRCGAFRAPGRMSCESCLRSRRRRMAAQRRYVAAAKAALPVGSS